MYPTYNIYEPIEIFSFIVIIILLWEVHNVDSQWTAQFTVYKCKKVDCSLHLLLNLHEAWPFNKISDYILKLVHYISLGTYVFNKKLRDHGFVIRVWITQFSSFFILIVLLTKISLVNINYVYDKYRQNNMGFTIVFIRLSR